MRALSLASVAASAAAAAPSYYQKPGAFAGNQCKPQLADASGAAWQFDFTAIAGLNVNYTAGAYVFPFSPCGTTDVLCLPGNTVQWPYAPGLQVFSGSQGSGSCIDPATGGVANCTGFCELLGQGPPLWSLTNSSDGAAGATVTYAGVRSPLDDPAQCPFNPALGSEQPRTLTVVYTCDATVPAGTVVSTGMDENPPCSYWVAARTAAACPSKAQPSAPLPPPSQPPAPADGSAFAPYLCTPALTDAAGATHAFNFTGLWAPQDYTFAAADGSTYSFNVCGAAHTRCVPAGWPVPVNAGGVTVVTGAAPAPQPDPPCQLVNGSIAACTGPCHVLGIGAPVWALADPASPAAGVYAALQPVRALPADPFQCPLNPATGAPGELSVALLLTCDAAVTQGLRVTGVDETAPCAYVVSAATAAACT